MIKKIIYKKTKGVSLLIFAFGITTILAFACFVLDVGMILNAQNELQKVVETTALVGATNLEPKQEAGGAGFIRISIPDVDNLMVQTYQNMLQNNALIKDLKNATITTNATSKAARIKIAINAATYFIRFIGIKSITIEAQAAAMSSPFYLSESFPKGLSPGSLIKESSGDTDIRKPVGDNLNKNSNYNNIYGYPNSKALSLGPGGYVTIRLPVPLLDGPGFDLYIKELGNLEGYYVFAGNDKDPKNPYVNEAIPGAGIEWVNISCTGRPVDAYTGGRVAPYYTTVNYKGQVKENEAKFYGSGYFNLGLTCQSDLNGITYTGNLKSASYLKIIDDNIEDGFLADYTSYPILLIGEHSSITPGADIDSVGILNHTRLISSKEFEKDSDNDKLIDILETIIGTNTNIADTDSDGLKDGTEYGGWSLDPTPMSLTQIGIAIGKLNLTNPNEADYSQGKVLKKMIIE